MAIQQLIGAKIRSAILQVPTSGSFTPGAAATNFEITEDIDGNAIPRGMKITGITVSHINPANGAAVSTKSDMRIYRSYQRLAKHIVYEDIAVQAETRKLNATEWDYVNEDRALEIVGDISIQTGAAACAAVIEITYQAHGR